jgi:HD-like signal output (HDOD) protein
MYGARDRVAETLWAHALATALAADEMREAKEPRGGAPFIAGLLHDIGRLVFHLTDPAAFARLGHWDEALERELYGVTHAIVGGVLVDMWRVGEGVAEAILEHHVRPARGLAARVAIADWVAHHIGLGSVPGEIPPVDTVEGLPADLEGVAERVARTFETERAFFD